MDSSRIRQPILFRLLDGSFSTQPCNATFDSLPAVGYTLCPILDSRSIASFHREPGSRAASGVYFCRLSFGSKTLTRSFINTM